MSKNTNSQNTVSQNTVSQNTSATPAATYRDIPPLQMIRASFIPWKISFGNIDVVIELLPMNRLPREEELVMVFLHPDEHLLWHRQPQLWYVKDGAWRARACDNVTTDQGIIDAVQVSSAAGWSPMPHTLIDVPRLGFMAVTPDSVA